MKLHTKLLIVGTLLMLPGGYLVPWVLYFSTAVGGALTALGWRERDQARGWKSYLTPEGSYVRLKGDQFTPEGWVEVPDPWGAP